MIYFYWLDKHAHCRKVTDKFPFHLCVPDNHFPSRATSCFLWAWQEIASSSTSFLLAGFRRSRTGCRRQRNQEGREADRCWVCGLGPRVRLSSSLLFPNSPCGLGRAPIPSRPQLTHMPAHHQELVEKMGCDGEECGDRRKGVVSRALTV